MSKPQNLEIKAHVALATVDTVVRNILLQPHKHTWQAQGLGMVRTYISPELRLHIWHSRFRVPGSSTIHTHPWSFEALVLGGTIRNRRFLCSMNGWGQHDYLRQQIVCGPTGDAGMPLPEEASLVPCEIETYRRGDAYSQRAEEIHETEFDDGTITLIERRLPADDNDSAFVYYPVGEKYTNRGSFGVSWRDVKPFFNLALEKMDGL